MRIPSPGVEVEVPSVLEMLRREVAAGMLLDVDEDSTALASAIETFAFALTKLV